MDYAGAMNSTIDTQVISKTSLDGRWTEIAENFERTLTLYATENFQNSIY